MLDYLSKLKTTLACHNISSDTGRAFSNHIYFTNFSSCFSTVGVLF
jgi:hypothetical protein